MSYLTRWPHRLFNALMAVLWGVIAYYTMAIATTTEWPTIAVLYTLLSVLASGMMWAGITGKFRWRSRR